MKNIVTVQETNYLTYSIELIYGDNNIKWNTNEIFGRDPKTGLYFFDNPGLTVKRTIVGQGWTIPDEYHILGKEKKNMYEALAKEIYDGDNTKSVFKITVIPKEPLFNPFMTPGREYIKYLIIEPLTSMFKELNID